MERKGFGGRDEWAVREVDDSRIITHGLIDHSKALAFCST